MYFINSKSRCFFYGLIRKLFIQQTGKFVLYHNDKRYLKGGTKICKLDC